MELVEQHVVPERVKLIFWELVLALGGTPSRSERCKVLELAQENLTLPVALLD